MYIIYYLFIIYYRGPDISQVAVAPFANTERSVIAKGGNVGGRSTGAAADGDEAYRFVKTGAR
jgi:hypothetical protein